MGKGVKNSSSISIFQKYLTVWAILCMVAGVLAGKNPKGLFVTWVVNWLIKPFTMYAVASLFLFTVFKGLIKPEMATEYLTGVVLLGAAPCTAMVFVWSTLTNGSPHTQWYRQRQMI